MLLETTFPYLPSTLAETIIVVVACLGAFLICYAVFVEKERRQDLMMTIGAACLFVYALYIQSAIFMIAMGGLFIATFIEFFEIYIGMHKHSPDDLKKYKAMK